MKKHILGLAIFSFIVCATAFAYGVFSHKWIDDLPFLSKMKKTRTTNDSPISQPLLKLTNNELVFKTDCTENFRGMVLYFYEKNGNANNLILIQQISSEDLEICHNNIVTKKIYWSNITNAKNNIYVVGYADYLEEASPYFDESRALPVLISYGKDEKTK